MFSNLATRLNGLLRQRNNNRNALSFCLLYQQRAAAPGAHPIVARRQAQTSALFHRFSVKKG